jgi:predicted nucleic acid-binding protein
MLQMNGRAFIDTNVFIYLYSEDENEKQIIAQKAVDKYECIISTQVLNEFSNICIKKLFKESEEIKLAIDEIIEQCSVIALEKEPFDYTKWQENLFENMTIEEISKNAAEYRKNNKIEL